MDIIFGSNVDLITPFPESEFHRVWPWLQCFQSIVFHDNSIKDGSEYEEYLRLMNSQGLTYGIIDKNNVTGSQNVETPIIGIVVFEPASPTNFYGHIATSRKAGKGYKLYGVSLVDEAVHLSTDYAFQTFPNLQRISAIILESNRPVRSLMSRTGFTQDGEFPRWFTQKGKPVTAVHYGLLRQES